MNGTANINPAGRSHFASAIPVPRAMAHGKPHTTAPPSTMGPHMSPRALSPQPAPGPKTLKPKGRAAGRERAEGSGGSPGVPRRVGQKVPARPLVPPGKWPEAGGSGRRGAGRAGEPTELPKAPPAQGRAGGRLGGGPGRGSGVTVAGTAGEPHSGSQGRGPVFGSGAITFSSGAPHNHPVTATVAPFQYRLQEHREEGDVCPGLDTDPGGPSESRGVCWEWGGPAVSRRAPGMTHFQGAGVEPGGGGYRWLPTPPAGTPPFSGAERAPSFGGRLLGEMPGGGCQGSGSGGGRDAPGMCREGEEKEPGTPLGDAKGQKSVRAAGLRKGPDLFPGSAPPAGLEGTGDTGRPQGSPRQPHHDTARPDLRPAVSPTPRP
ncbi:LOW QUALITY PROTEIN: uncharacterized protein ENSP00000471857-like [Strigops habroptila]|uniref:LOW QUALITY PROTEIN: uncharacterized protein ENSP00000471857-like n=1 Tax=Strigops habroptila TaxID=2489341 RepID=UPI0011CFA29F|nr:LOW QUALITY PROTEIN: uncharacterized protein ENSP00000471857-like [Strigops habroptila]